MNRPISIVIAASQEAVKEHFGNSGWEITWRRGEPTEKHPGGEPLDDGVIEGKNAIITQIRSAEIPWRLSLGRDSEGKGFDIGLVGTDCFIDHPGENLTLLTTFLYGRSLNGDRPRLSIFSREGSAISTIEDIKREPIEALMTERPHLCQRYLDAQGIPNEIFWSESDYEGFANKAQSEGKIPIKVIEGAGGQQIRGNELLAMVAETGRRQRNYNLHEVVELCTVETLALANTRSYQDRYTRIAINRLVRDLEAGYLSVETEGIRNPERSFLGGERQ